MYNFIMMVSMQIFADTQTTLLDGLSAEMKTFYDMTLIDEASPNLVHGQFGQKRPIPAHGGKTIEFRKFAPLAKSLTPLTEGVTPEGDNLEVTAITSTVNQYGRFVKISDVLDLTAIDPVVVETVKLVGRQSGGTIDTIDRNVLNSGTNVFYCPKVAADGTETAVTSRSGLDKTCGLTVDVVMQVAAKLEAQNAPKIDGHYVGIIHPLMAYQLMKDKDWERAHVYTNPENIYEGELGRIAGVRFVKSSEAKIFGSADGAPAGLGVFSTIIFGADAFGVTEVAGGGLKTIIKQKGSAGTADPLDQVSSVGWKAMLTAEILIPRYLVRVEGCSAKFSPNLAAN